MILAWVWIELSRSSCGAIVEYRNGKQAGGALNSWFSESPTSASYIRLPGDSGRIQASDFQLFMSDYGMNSGSSASSSAAQIMKSSGVQSPIRHRVASN
ncbi:PREDICTED: legume-specific [Prunus dulcis]|uniref:PREDICTED: legume-specific n=1 Tax=Prunus dulcis TaxID=3755 RepID=A0A5E4FMD3_PRUDU|nr:hypothetical protein L3X38_034767 [Prunus dulcis]VVA28749.1 PREDICTED: legume-specific [Prunus dulcis]